MGGEKTAAAMSRHTADWCHLCGNRKRDLADVWYPDNAEHDKPVHACGPSVRGRNYIRVCDRCGERITDVARGDAAEPVTCERLLAAGFGGNPFLVSSGSPVSYGVHLCFRFEYLTEHDPADDIDPPYAWIQMVDEGGTAHDVQNVRIPFPADMGQVLRLVSCLGIDLKAGG